jgi:hypothetical protein
MTPPIWFERLSGGEQSKWWHDAHRATEDLRKTREKILLLWGEMASYFPDPRAKMAEWFPGFGFEK